MGAAVATIVVLLAMFTLLFRPTTGGAPPPVFENPVSGALSPVPTPTPANQQKKEIQGNASVFTGHDPVSGNITWTLKARSILLRDTDKRADAKDVACTFYNREGQPVATVTCAGCVVNLGNNNLQFQGRVTATDPTGQTLTIEHLRYDGLKKRFFGHGGVRMTRATSVVLAEKMWADPSLKTLQLDGNVQAYVRTIAVRTPAPVPAPTIPPLYGATTGP